MENNSKFIPGMEVYVILRDEDGKATDMAGFLFLAHVEGYAILSTFVNAYDIRGILAYHAQCTSEEFGTDLFVFQDEDCYTSYDDCKADFEKENLFP